MKYHFEKEQPLKIIIKKEEDSDIELEYNVMLGTIISSKNNTLKVPINSAHSEIIVITVIVSLNGSV